MTKFITNGTVSNTAVAWGTDGINIFTMLNNTLTPVTSTISPKYWNLGSAVGFKRILKMGWASVLSAPTTATLSLLNESGTQLPQPFGSQAQNVTNYLIFIGANGNPITWTN